MKTVRHSIWWSLNKWIAVVGAARRPQTIRNGDKFSYKFSHCRAAIHFGGKLWNRTHSVHCSFDVHLWESSSARSGKCFVFCVPPTYPIHSQWMLSVVLRTLHYTVVRTEYLKYDFSGFWCSLMFYYVVTSVARNDAGLHLMTHFYFRILQFTATLRCALRAYAVRPRRTAINNSWCDRRTSMHGGHEAAQSIRTNQ